ncbi:MAG: response regulator transcription factor [Prevotella sp.]|nr:response regulator transcription factor [Prevotella sp.]
MDSKRPEIAIINPNTLAVLGLKNILQEVIPVAVVDTYGSFTELQANNPDKYYHYFVSMDVLLRNRNFFSEHRNKTIVLTTGTDPESQPGGFHCICVNVPEQQLIKSLLTLEQRAHANGRNLPPQHRSGQVKTLSDREIEVMALIIQGLINKEIATRLNISITTVNTHRKNIMEKLNIKSVSALTIYAVTHGYVDISKI